MHRIHRRMAALALALLIAPYALAADAPAGDLTVTPTVETAEAPLTPDPLLMIPGATPQAQCSFNYLYLFPSGTPQQACVGYCTSGGGTFDSYDQSNALYWVCSCCPGD